VIVDSSAILAILFNEPDATVYATAIATAIASAQSCRISAANCVEAAVVIESQSPAAGARQFDTFMRRAGITVEPVTRPIPIAARAVTPLALTLETAFPMRWPWRRASRCCSTAMTSAKPM
jgi:uncharacterized protein with PIN domain